MPILVDEFEPETINALGTIFGVDSHVLLLQAGFDPQFMTVDGLTTLSDVNRADDNAILIEIRPLLAALRRRDQLRQSFPFAGDNVTNPEEFLNVLGQSVPATTTEIQERANQLASVILAPATPGTPVSSDQLAGVGGADDLFLIMAVNEIIEGVPDPNQGERFFFAAGDVDGERDLTFTVDKFFVSPGLSGLPINDEGELVLELDGPSVAQDDEATPINEGIRAFLRKETAFDNPDTPEDESVPLKDTGVQIVNTRPDEAAALEFDEDHQTALFHADFGVVGTGANQKSTIAITIGEIKYGVDIRQPFEITSLDDEQNSITRTVDEPGNEVVVHAHTFGSSRDNTEREMADDPTPASTFISSELFNTAAGGGNPALVDESGNPRTGRVGYLVFENFNPDAFEADEQRTGVDEGSSTPPEQPATGGVEDPVDPLEEDLRKEEQRYAILRLGTAVRSVEQVEGTDEDAFSPHTIGPRTTRTLEGFAAGIGEFQTGDDIGVVPVDAGLLPDDSDPLASDPLTTAPLAPNLHIETNAETNRVLATADLTGLALGNETISMGGPTAETRIGTSAFVDDDTFAARTPSGEDIQSFGEYALVTALPLTNPVDPANPNDPNRTVPGFEDTPFERPRHVQWGWFLGERLGPFEGQNVREHVHLGAWAAGEQLRDDMLGGWAGTASYEGVAAGNVFRGTLGSDGVTGGNLSTVVGTYRNQWDFGERRGSVEMSFDASEYTGSTRLQDGSARFVGTLEATGRRGRLDGSFVGGVSDFSDGSGRGPNGLAGQFSIRETGNTEVYRATGVVAADRKRK